MKFNTVLGKRRRQKKQGRPQITGRVLQELDKEAKNLKRGIASPVIDLVSFQEELKTIWR
jgi:hypothetical protein